MILGEMPARLGYNLANAWIGREPMAGKRQPDPIPAGTARTLGAAQPAPPTRASEANASNVGLLGRFAGRSQTIWFWAGLLGVITLALGDAGVALPQSGLLGLAR